MLQQYSLLVTLTVAAFFVAGTSALCTSIPLGEPLITALDVPFGYDPEGERIDRAILIPNWTEAADYALKFGASNYKHVFTYLVNGVTLAGGKNWASYNSSFFEPTASFACDSDYSGLWGPAYPDIRKEFGFMRGQFQNLETYVHYSIPNETSYVRSIIFIKNVGDQSQRVRLAGDWKTEHYNADRAPLTSEGRYIVGYPFQEGDTGKFGDADPFATLTATFGSMHARGPRSRESRVVAVNDGRYRAVYPAFYGNLAAGEELALMFIVSVNRNLTTLLANAAEIDSEPAHIFHNLNADQLAKIRNWGGCEVILAPDVTVTVNQPSQCVAGETNEFTVETSTTRSDFTSDFTHRVISARGRQIISAQSSNKLNVPNGVGALKHQLWYNGCLIKETMFTACANTAAPLSSSVPVAVPVKTTSNASFNAANSFATSAILALLGLALTTKQMRLFQALIVVTVAMMGVVVVDAQDPGTCTNLAVGENSGNPIAWQFGYQDGENGQPRYIGYVYRWWITNQDMYTYVEEAVQSSHHQYWINGAVLQPGKNNTLQEVDPSPFVSTASFECDTNYSGMWGPLYPDVRGEDYGIRARYQNLEAYIHYSAPNETSYIRSILFVKNVGNTPERVRLNSDWYNDNYAADISPENNNGRYATCYELLNGDFGPNGDRFGPDGALITSNHAAGPKGREAENIQLVNDVTVNIISPAYYTILQPGQDFALMFITSYGTNQSVAGKNAAWIDSEPAHIFHNLNADQLAKIRNWGGCEVILAPDVTVTVNQPSQCVAGETNEFTVETSTTRSDFTSDFTHRVISDYDGFEEVAAQSSSTLAVPNGAGLVRHQLWYKECLVKETPFEACAFAAPTSGSVPVANTPSKKSNMASTFDCFGLLILAFALLWLSY